MPAIGGRVGNRLEAERDLAIMAASKGVQKGRRAAAAQRILHIATLCTRGVGSARVDRAVTGAYVKSID